MDRYYIRADEVMRRILCSPADLIKYDDKKDMMREGHSEHQLEKTIKSIPPADVKETIHATWKIVKDANNNKIYFCCSNCNHELPCILPLKQVDYKVPYPRERFCSYCGANMQKENSSV